MKFKLLITLFSSFFLGKIIIYAQPANDEYTSATVISLGINSCTTTTSGTTQNATKSEQTADGNSYEKDVWFTFKSSTAQVLTLQGFGQDIHKLIYSIYIKEGNSIRLYDHGRNLNSYGSQYHIFKDSTYYIKVGDRDPPTQFYNFTICGYLTDNDEISTAKTIDVATFGRCDLVKVLGTTKSASLSNKPLPACLPADAINKNDVWYKFIAPIVGNIHLNTYHEFDRPDFKLAVALYQGADLTPVECLTSTIYQTNYIVVNSPAIGTEYYIQVFTPDSGPEKNGGFGICAVIYNPPANDDASNAAQITISDYQCVESSPWSTRAATSSVGVYPPCDEQITGSDGAENDDVWGMLEVIRDGTIKIELKNYPSYYNSMGVVLQFYTKDVNGGFIKDTCGFFTGDYDFIFQVTKGKKYYVRAFTPETSPANFATFTLCAYYIPPLNDEPNGAFDIPVSENNSCNGVNSRTYDATQSLVGCKGTADDDVWFKFTATAEQQYVNVTPAETRGIGDVVFEVFSGNLESLIPIVCINETKDGNPEEALIPDLTIGETYFVRVFSYLVADDSRGNFNICIAPSKPSKVNLLLNASFETPEVEGNNSFAKDAIPNWALNESAILFKEFEGGYTYPGGPDTAHHGKQYLNINAFEGIAEQNFSLTSPAEVEFGGWFSGKDPTLGDDFFGNVFIVDNDDDGFSLGTIINSSDTLKKADFQTNKNWKSVAKKIVLPKGNFTFRLRMHVTANFDAAFVNIVKLYPAQAILWSGLVDNTWENPNNWFGGILPGPTSDVIIAGSKTIVVNSDVTIKSLTLRYGADFNANGGNLTILGY